MVDTANQARRWCLPRRYPPYGERGVGPVWHRLHARRRVELHGASQRFALSVGVQVESKTALDNLDEILRCEGIDGVFWTCRSFSSLGYPDNADTRRSAANY
ncbi:aldolase/citrate lyase family protein [Shigella flexneri]